MILSNSNTMCPIILCGSKKYDPIMSGWLTPNTKVNVATPDIILRDLRGISFRYIICILLKAKSYCLKTLALSLRYV